MWSMVINRCDNMPRSALGLRFAACNERFDKAGTLDEFTLRAFYTFINICFLTFLKLIDCLVNKFWWMGKSFFYLIINKNVTCDLGYLWLMGPMDFKNKSLSLRNVLLTSWNCAISCAVVKPPKMFIAIWTCERKSTWNEKSKKFL